MSNPICRRRSRTHFFSDRITKYYGSPRRQLQNKTNFFGLKSERLPFQRADRIDIFSDILLDKKNAKGAFRL